MVVDYYFKRSIGTPPVAGVFIAAKEYNKILRASEPREHDRWEPTAKRLKPGEGDIIRKLLDNSWAGLKKFQSDARPSEDPSKKRMTVLERSLAKWFGSSSKGKGQPEKDPTPVTLKSRAKIVEHDAMYRIEGSFTVGLKSDFEHDSLDVEVKLICAVVDEDKVSRTETIPIKIDEAPDIVIEEKGVTAYLSKGTGTKILFKSDLYDPSWTVKFIPEVTPIQEGST